MKKILLIGLLVIILIVISLLILPASYLSSQRSFDKVSIQGEGYQINGYLSQGTEADGKWVVLVHGNRQSGQEHELCLLYTSPSPRCLLYTSPSPRD